MGTPILYQFNVPGYIPGVPDVFSAGTWAKIDPDTNALLETGTLALDLQVSPPLDVLGNEVKQDNLPQGG